MPCIVIKLAVIVSPVVTVYLIIGDVTCASSPQEAKVSTATVTVAVILAGNLRAF